MGSRKPTAVADVPAEFRDLHRQIEQWRRVRRHREPMPAPLWSQAASLAGQHGIAPVARCLRLDYYSLKERHDALVRTETARAEAQPAFVELALPSAVPVPECVVELEHPRGARMRIHLKGGGVPDLAVLTRSFWGAEL